MSNQHVLEVFKAQNVKVGSATVHMIGHLTEAQPLSLDEALATAASMGFSMGLELGLSIAVTDIAAGRMLLRFYRDVREESDVPVGLSDQSDHGRALMAEAFLEVLK